MCFNNSKILVLLILLLGFKTVIAADTLTVIKTGHIDSAGIFKLVYVPVIVPAGITRIEVKESYNESNHPNMNVLNMGIYDERGYQPGNPAGFRGWSGGAKTEFFISAQSASTGYVPGAINPGEWNVLIYPSTIIRQGIDWQLEIKLIKGEPEKACGTSPAQTKLNNKPGWYRGDLHIHTLHSDGKRTVQELVDEAKAKKLDYIISTEHNTNSANLNWGKYNSSQLLIINGEEVTTTQFGHWNAIGLNSDTYIDWRYTPQDGMINQMINKVHHNQGLAIINHPFFNIKMVNSFGFDVNLFDGIEVWNGTWSILNERALQWWDTQLRLGHKKIAIGASDTHQAAGSPNNLGAPQTVVYAGSLSKQGIINGIKSGKAYVAVNSSIEIDFSAGANGHNAGLGDTLTVKPTNKITVWLNVKNCINHTAKIYTNNGLAKTQAIPLANSRLQFEVSADKLKYLRAEIRDNQGKMVAFTNPVWVSAKP